MKKAFAEGLARGARGLYQPDPVLAQVYELRPAEMGMRVKDSRSVFVVFYESKFLKITKRALRTNGLLSDIDESDSLAYNDEWIRAERDLVEGQDLDLLMKALRPYSNVGRGKLLFVSAYLSARKGLSLNVQEDGQDRNFDFIVMANHPFYDPFLRRRDQRLATMEQFQTACKHRLDCGESGIYTMTEVGRQMVEDRYELFRDAAQRYHFTNALQCVGRLDRGNDLPVSQNIYLHDDFVTVFVEGDELSPELCPRTSKIPHAVIKKALAIAKERSPCIEDWDIYEMEEVALARKFARAVAALKQEVFHPNLKIRSAAVVAWNAIRSVEAFVNPSVYLEKLRAMRWPIEDGLKNAFLEYAFMPVDRFGGNPSCYREHSTGEYVDGDCIRILADFDHANGGSFYNPCRSSMPQLNGHEAPLCDLNQTYKRLGLHREGMFREWLPRPLFLINFLKGVLGELCLRNVLQKHEVQILPDKWALELNVFETFDFYILDRKGRLIAIDQKHWSRQGDRKRAKELKAKAVKCSRQVLDAVRTAADRSPQYAKLASTSLRFVYLNLCGSIGAPREKTAGMYIDFYSLFNEDGMLSQRFMETIDGKG
jgi:hypothetical protein